MSLPNITIPEVNIPFDIPTLLHPSLAHFAVAIPVLVVIAEIFNLFIKGKGIKIMSSLFMFLLIIIFFAMYLTGSADAKMALDSGFGATDVLDSHKLLGMYIFYLSIFVFVLKLISLGVDKTGFRVFYILVLFGFLTSVILQSNSGMELVYKHGANIQTKQTKTKIEPTTTPEKSQKKEDVKKEKEVKTIKTNKTIDTNETNKTSQTIKTNETNQTEEKKTILDQEKTNDKNTTDTNNTKQ